MAGLPAATNTRPDELRTGVVYTDRLVLTPGAVVGGSGVIILVITGGGSCFEATATEDAEIQFDGDLEEGQEITLTIHTSGTTSWALTFEAGIRNQGTLATGTVTAKRFVLVFVGNNGGVAAEVSRTIAM